MLGWEIDDDLVAIWYVEFGGFKKYYQFIFTSLAYKCCVLKHHVNFKSCLGLIRNVVCELCEIFENTVFCHVLFVSYIDEQQQFDFLCKIVNAVRDITVTFEFYKNFANIVCSGKRQAVILPIFPFLIFGIIGFKLL
jgi:hypothetical protein